MVILSLFCASSIDGYPQLGVSYNEKRLSTTGLISCIKQSLGQWTNSTDKLYSTMARMACAFKASTISTTRWWLSIWEAPHEAIPLLSCCLELSPSMEAACKLLGLLSLEGTQQLSRQVWLLYSQVLDVNLSGGKIFIIRNEGKYL